MVTISLFHVIISHFFLIKECYVTYLKDVSITLKKVFLKI